MDIYINFSNSCRDLIKNVFTNFVLESFAEISILEEFLKRLFRIYSRIFPQKSMRYYLKINLEHSLEISSGIP